MNWLLKKWPSAGAVGSSNQLSDVSLGLGWAGKSLSQGDPAGVRCLEQATPSCLETPQLSD